MTNVVVDHGYAWTVTIGGFLMNTLVVGFLKSYGVLMVEFKQKYNCTNSVAMLTGGLMYSVIVVLAPLATVITGKIGTRRTVMIGGFGAFACLIGIAYCTHVIVWVTLMGPCLGSTLSMVYTPVICMVSKCFSKYRTLANGISVCGAGVGYMAYPALFTFLLKHYQLDGTIIITAAIFLNLVVAALLMPTSVTHKKRIPVLSRTTFSSINDFVEISRNDLHTSVVHTDQETSRCDFDIPLTLLFAAGSLLSNISFIGQYTMFATFSHENRISDERIVQLLGIQGVIDLFSRILTGLFADLMHKRIRRVYILTTAIWVTAVAAVAVTLWPTHLGLLSYSVVFGLTGGAYNALLAVVLTDFVGIEKLNQAFSVVMVFWGCSNAPAQLALGALRDSTSSFAWSLRTVAAFMLLSGIFLILEQPLKRLLGYPAEETIEEEI